MCPDGRERRQVAAAAPFSWVAACQLPPQGEIVELRAYLRQRERLLEYAASHIQHMQKALTEMNLQLHHVVTDITGATGLRIIRAILAGERDPAVLALLRDTRCHANVETITKALKDITVPSTYSHSSKRSPQHPSRR
jgi:hypothetical protein